MENNTRNKLELEHGIIHLMWTVFFKIFKYPSCLLQIYFPSLENYSRLMSPVRTCLTVELIRTLQMHKKPQHQHPSRLQYLLDNL